MNLKEQLYVCTLAKTGSLSQAAKELCISSPALSLYISNLENILGLHLFDRIGKQFVLTYAGELYVEKGRQMLELKEKFDSEILEIVEGKRERLRVGIQAIRSESLTPAILPPFARQFPHVILTWSELSWGQFADNLLLNNELDLIFCNCESFRSELAYIPILDDELVFLVHKDHPLLEYAKILPDMSYPWIDLKLFENERFILAEENQSIRKCAEQVLSMCGVNPRERFFIHRNRTIIGLINEGYGVGFSQISYLSMSKAPENLCILSTSRPPIKRKFCAMYRKGRPLSPAASILINLVQSTVKEQLEHSIAQFTPLQVHS